MWVGGGGTGSRTPGSGPGLGFSAGLGPLSAPGHGSSQGSSPQSRRDVWCEQGSRSPLLLPARAPCVAGLAGRRPFRHPDLSELNVTRAEPLPKPVAGEVDNEV